MIIISFSRSFISGVIFLILFLCCITNELFANSLLIDSGVKLDYSKRYNSYFDSGVVANSSNDVIFENFEDVFALTTRINKIKYGKKPVKSSKSMDIDGLVSKKALLDLQYSEVDNSITKNILIDNSQPLNENKIYSKTKRVALLLPLTGRFSHEGEAILNASQLALFDIASEHFRLLPFDTGGSATGAEAAIRKALNMGVKLVIGPLLSEEVSAIAPIAAASDVKIVAFSNDLSVAGDGVYLIGHTPLQQVDRIVNFAVDRGKRRFAALLPDTRYGHAVLVQYQDIIDRLNAKLSRIGFYNPNASDASEVVKEIADYINRKAALKRERKILKLKDDEIARKALIRLEAFHTLGEVPFDALLLADESERLRQIVPLIPYFDIDPTKVQLLGLELWNDPNLLSEPALIGGVYAAPAPEDRIVFNQRYKKIYGDLPLRVAALAYDATAIAAIFYKGNKFFSSFEKFLTAQRGFFGVSGAFRFTNLGFSERKLAIIKVGKGGKSAVIDPTIREFK